MDNAHYAAAAKRGKAGEDLAVEHYVGQGYTLLHRNYHSRFGEVDVIAGKAELLVFCEVKARGAGALARPAAWVDGPKQRKIIKTAQIYINQHKIRDKYIRFDVVEVFVDKSGKTTLNCIENAFDTTGYS